MSSLLSSYWSVLLGRVWEFVTLDRRGRRRERTIILIGCLAVTLFLYHRAVESLDPARSIFRFAMMEVTAESYRMYSGSAGGMYAKIASDVVERSLQHGGFEVAQVEVGSSRRILDKVLDDPGSFGLVQQDVLGESINSNVKMLMPLYNERVHAVYRWSALRQSSGAETCSVAPVISEKPDDATRRLFQRSTVRLGSVRPSGGRLNLAQRVLEIAGLQPRQQEFHSIKRTLQLLEEGRLDIALITVGAPLDSLAELLDRPDEKGLCLMSVDPRFVRVINDAYDTRYRATGFSGIYHHRHDEVSTLGIPAVLVANRGMPESALGRIAAMLLEVRSAQNGDYHPFDDYEGSLERVSKDAPGRLQELVEAVALFSLFMAVAATLLNILATWVLSSTKEVLYFRRLNQIYRELPSHVELSEGAAGLPMPDLEMEDRDVLGRIIAGISRLLGLVMDIRDDYETGGITASHHSHLIRGVYEIKEIFMRHLSQRINRSLEVGSVPLAGEDLLRLYTAGYLFRGDYRDLSRLLAAAQSAVPKLRKARAS